MLRCDVCNYFTNNKVRNKVKNYKLWFLRNNWCHAANSGATFIGAQHMRCIT